jgi:membrane-bound inhibitor of C-type lysozyme
MRTAFWLFAFSLTLVSGCSLWPFGERGDERSRAPENATEYRCDAGKRFYLRYLNNSESAWIIFPERQFRLDKTAAPSGTRYAYGTATLDVAGDTLTLNDGPGVAYTGCKRAEK